MVAEEESQACKTISQLVIYNTKERCTDESRPYRSNLNREPPLPLYIGLNVHSRTRSKALIKDLHSLGISVSYHRVLEIEEWLASSVSERYESDGVVCPAHLRKGLFTVAALDNQDHNPSSSTAQGAFHGTSISLFQNVDSSHQGEMRNPIRIPPISKEKHHIPADYATVPLLTVNMKSANPPNEHIPMDCSNDGDRVKKARNEENTGCNMYLPRWKRMTATVTR